MNKMLVYFLLGFISFILNVAIYYADHPVMNGVENKINDFFIQKKVASRPYKSQNVIIIDVDEDSLEKIGQWPWGRDKIARVLDNLNEAGVGIVGLDITFAQKDGKSPSTMFDNHQEYPRPKNVKNYDDILANSLATTPSIMGIMMYFEQMDRSSEQHDYRMPITTAFNEINTSSLMNAQVIISNLPVLQNSGYSSGFLNTLPDPDGIIRYIPMIIANDENIFPSLSLEIARLIFGAERIDVHNDEFGVFGISLGDLLIDTDDLGRYLVNYKGGIDSYEYISAYDIYTNNFDKEKIKSKVALIGTTALGLVDNRSTPIGLLPGVQIHAMAIDNILQQDYMVKANNGYVDILIMLFIMVGLVFSFLLKRLIISIGVCLSIIVFVSYTSYLYFIEQNILISLIYPITSWAITFIIFILYKVFSEQKQKEKIGKMFSKKVSKKVMENLLSQEVALGGTQQKEVSVFFSDIRGFTSMSEKLSPARVVELLNEYMTPMADIIDKYNGTVDKFIGDAIMAYWNAPYDLKNHADFCLQSSIEQIKALRRMQKDFEIKYGSKLDIGIGINTGEVVVGDIGSSGRSDYTVIGDTVNLASRVESLNKQYGTSIIITEFTKKELKEEYNIKFLDSVVVKGKTKSVDIYEVVVEE